GYGRDEVNVRGSRVSGNAIAVPVNRTIRWADPWLTGSPDSEQRALSRRPCFPRPCYTDEFVKTAFDEWVKHLARIVQQSVRAHDIVDTVTVKVHPVCRIAEAIRVAFFIKLTAVAHHAQVVRLALVTVPTAVMEAKGVTQFVHKSCGLDVNQF